MAGWHYDGFGLSHPVAQLEPFVDRNNSVTGAQDQENFFRIDKGSNGIRITMDALADFSVQFEPG